MSGASIIIEIPIEVLHIIFRVEKDDPLKPLMDGMKSIKKIESNHNLSIDWMHSPVPLHQFPRLVSTPHL